MTQQIMTVKELRKAIRTCDVVLVMLRFGLSEHECKLSKKEALAFIEDLGDDVTPESHGMFGSSFGYIIDNELHMG